jgi:hypothetical protein
VPNLNYTRLAGRRIFSPEECSTSLEVDGELWLVWRKRKISNGKDLLLSLRSAYVSPFLRYGGDFNAETGPVIITKMVAGISGLVLCPFLTLFGFFLARFENKRSDSRGLWVAVGVSGLPLILFLVSVVFRL